MSHKISFFALLLASVVYACDTGDALDGQGDLLNVSCGDARAEGLEACDGPDLDNKVCEDFEMGPGNLKCESDCSAFDLSECAPKERCGNGEIDEGETCDGVLFASPLTCASFNLGEGELGCEACTMIKLTGCAGGEGLDDVNPGDDNGNDDGGNDDGGNDNGGDDGGDDGGGVLPDLGDGLPSCESSADCEGELCTPLGVCLACNTPFIDNFVSCEEGFGCNDDSGLCEEGIEGDSGGGTLPDLGDVGIVSCDSNAGCDGQVCTLIGYCAPCNFPFVDQISSCGLTQTCNDDTGLCESAIPEVENCTEDDDCPDGVCSDAFGVCVQCAESSDCDEGNSCVFGFCL